MLGGLAAAAPAAAPVAVSDLPLLLGGDKAKGLSVYGKLTRAGGQIMYQLHVNNASAGSVDGLLLQVSRGTAGGRSRAVLCMHGAQ